MIYGYIRVSTDKQDTENQKYEILKFCENNNIIIDKWVGETISGAKAIEKRTLGELKSKLLPNDLIICTELSRIGRSLFMIMEFLNYCMEHNCQIWTTKENYKLGDNLESKVLAFAFGLSAEIERNLIAERTKKALEKKKQDGVKLGRPTGHTYYGKITGLENKKDIIINMQQKGYSKVSICKELGISRSTLYRYIHENKMKL